MFYFEAQFRSPYAKIGFRLEDFTVYASLLSLPTAAQDSLCGVFGYTSTAGLSPARYAKLFLAHNYQELVNRYIDSCWNPIAQNMAIGFFQPEKITSSNNDAQACGRMLAQAA